ncbi:hypothetical protein FB451DRAFT_1280771 [Mycena latifolia]|nr:hypothetical protein FB451DRAFT_1280771 [Mycena latifolia]
MRFAALLPILFAGLGLVHAADDRLLFKIPNPGALSTFASDFATTCATWEPAIHGDSLIFNEALVEAGDFSGNNTDSEARLVCAWTNGETTPTFTADVAESLGATPA